MQLSLLSSEQTAFFAEILAKYVKQGDCLALSGPLGAGKSMFARAFLRSMVEDPALEVPSPSFSLVQAYETPKGKIFHYDLWRLSGPDELYELDWDEACESLMIVEWPDRAETLLPRDALLIEFRYGSGEEERSVILKGWPEERLEAVKKRFVS